MKRMCMAMCLLVAVAGCAVLESDEFQALKKQAVAIAKAYGEQRGDEYLAQMVAEGKLTQEQADEIRAAYKKAQEKPAEVAE